MCMCFFFPFSVLQKLMPRGKTQLTLKKDREKDSLKI